MRRFYIQLIADIVIGIFVFFFSLWLHNQAISLEISRYFIPALLFYSTHLFFSLIFQKYEPRTTYKIKILFRLWYRSWIYTTGLALLFIFTLQVAYFSRTIILFNIFGLLIGELLFLAIIYLFRKSVRLRDKDEILEEGAGEIQKMYPPVKKELVRPGAENIKSNIAQESGPEVLDFIEKHIDLDNDATLVTETISVFNIRNIPEGHYRQIVNLNRINDIREINRFFEALNSRLSVGGTMLLCGETKNLRKKRLLNKYPPVLNYVYYFFDFMLMRFFPKFPVFRDIYMAITRGMGQVLSRAEILGRIFSCGFVVVDEQKINGKLYVVAQKTREPFFDEHPTYGLLIFLNRFGRGGKMIKVYKLRTMHPYSEYIQEYVYQKNDLDENGKINHDFRITTEGRIFRKFWLDELPMIWNYLRGDLKLVGVRPLSKHYLSLYSPEMQQKHLKNKPGLIPPYYADLPKTLEEIQASEAKYLDAYEKKPFRTDVGYFFRAMKNILFKQVRSS